MIYFLQRPFAVILTLLVGLSCATNPSQKSRESRPPVDPEELCIEERSEGPQRDPAQFLLRCDAIFKESPRAADLQLQPTEVLKTRFGKIENKVDRQNWVENELNILQFIRKKDYENRAEGLHGAEVYGRHSCLSYLNARDFLDQIPLGQLRLSHELLQKTHSLAYDQERPLFAGKFLDGYFGRATSASRPTSFKMRNNYGGDALRNPLSEIQYEALKNNPWLKSFIELPWPLSRKDHRRGLIVYADHREIPQRLDELFQWVEVQRGKMDPIELAATFQHALISLHPFVDGNGRTSMLLMNRLLREFKLPPMILSNAEFDLYLPPQAWAAEVRKGVQEFLDLAKDVSFSDVPSVNRLNFSDGPRTNLIPSSPRKKSQQGEIDLLAKKVIEESLWMEQTMAPKDRSKEIRIGGQPFIMLPDGFFYNDSGIPYALHESILYPISDRAYLLYAEQGEARPTRFSKRRISSSHRALFSNHFKTLRAAREGKINLSEIKIVPYSEIESANNSGDLFLHPWQKDLFSSAISIRDSDPFLVLANARGYSTNFERSVEFGMKVTSSEVLAQYQLMDLKYQNYLAFAKSQKENEWVHEIQISREKLFNAAKTLIRSVEKKVKALSIGERMSLENDPKWSLFMNYLQQTALRYDSFAEAQKEMPPGRIVILRSDMSVGGLVGFRSNQSYVELAKKLPGYELFYQFIREAAGHLKEGRKPEGFMASVANRIIPNFQSLVPRIEAVLSAHRYDHRGIEPEFDREFVDHYLHSINSPLKTSASFSTSTDLYIRTEVLPDGTVASKLPFTFENVPSYLYFVETSIDDVSASISTKYFRQYEVLALKNVSARRILKRVSLNDLSRPIQNNSPGGRRIKRFMEEDYYVYPRQQKQ